MYTNTYVLHKITNFSRGLLEMVDFERRVIPTFGLEEVVLEESVRKIVDAILNTGGCGLVVYRLIDKQTN